MKIIPIVPACQNMEELQKLTNLICECVHPEMIVLFGHYADMALHDIQEGYELLIISEEEPSMNFRELMNYLNIHSKPEERKEKKLSLHLCTLDFVHHRSSVSHFLYSIRKEGILLYKSESCHLRDHVSYKPVLTHRKAVGFSEQCMALGRAFLQDAQRHIENGIPRIAAYYLYQANVQFVRAGNMVYYGYLSENREDLLTSYLKIRYCSEELAGLWGGDGNLAEWRLFGRLQSFSFKARFCYPFKMNSELLAKCLASTQKTEKAIAKLCKDRIEFLASFIH